MLSKDGRDIYGMFFVNRTDRRATPAQRAELALGEAPHGTPPSISAWWHPGDLEGRTFLYAPGEASWERPTSERSGD